MILQIIMKKKPDSNITSENKADYSRMVKIYNDVGFQSYFTYAKEISDITSAVSKNKPDIIFCGIDHITEKIENLYISHNVHKFFDKNNINYVGSEPQIIDLALSKAALKQKWEKDGIRTPPFIPVEPSTDLRSILKRLLSLDAFPYIIKPENLGNSKGIDENNIVWNAEDFRLAFGRMRSQYGGTILVEHYLGAYPDVMEITCAMIQGRESLWCMPAQLSLSRPKRFHLITTEDKDGHHTCLRPLEPDLAAFFVPFARKAFESAGVRDYARGDFFFADGKLWAIEINGQPMVPDRWFEGAVRFAGLSEAQYLVGIIAAAYRRLRKEGRIEEPFPERAQELLKGTALGSF